MIKMEVIKVKKRMLIEGMSCMHCVKHVHDAVMEIEGVSNVNVDLKGKDAVVEFEDGAGVTDEELKSAVEDAGYDVVRIENL